MHSPLSVFPPKKNPNMKKALFDWPIVLQYDVKAKYPLISGKFSGMKYFHPSVRLTNQKPRALYPFDKPIKLLYFRSFVVSVLFARFHFKIIRKSLYYFRVIALQFLLLFIRFPAIQIPVYIAPKCGTPLWHETYPICVGHSTFEVGTAQFRFVSEIARKSSPYCVWIEALFGLVFVSAQKLSGILWT